MGYVLTVIFRVPHQAPVLGFYGLMIFAAAWIIRSRVSEKTVAFFLPTLASMLTSYFIITYVVTALVVDVHPWRRPQVFLPLGGMLIGNSMNAVAIALNVFLANFAVVEGMWKRCSAWERTTRKPIRKCFERPSRRA